MKDSSISVKDTPISERDTTGIVTEVLRDAPHRKMEGDVLDSQPILGARTKGLIPEGRPSLVFLLCCRE